MQTMYDRLGELLNETLEAGEVRFVRHDFSEEREGADPVMESSAEKTESESGKDEIPENEGIHEEKKTRHPLKRISPEIERALRLLEVSAGATSDELKHAYREKIRYYHPDRYQGNEVMNKVATKKTIEVVEAYEKLLEFIGG